MKQGMTGIERVLDRSRIIVAGHRGAAALFPENTLTGYRRALELGVDMLEIDLQRTADGEIVLIHDARADRTTDGSGLIREMTLEQVRRLDAGVRFAPEYRGERIPTLRELCELLRGWPGILLNVEIKEMCREIVDQAVALLDEYHLVEKCVFTCFDAEILAYLAEGHGLKTQGFPAEYMDHFRPGADGSYARMFAAALSMRPFDGKPDMPLLSRERVEAFWKMGLEAWCFCPDSEEQVREAMRSGATLYTCNDPRPALRLLAEAGLR